MNVSIVANEILKQAVEIGEIDPKIANRIKQVKKVYQQINEIQKTIKEQVGDLQDQIKALEKQGGIFLKEVLPVLKDLGDHAITAEGIFIELKKGRRSPKVGYEALAEKVSSELLMAAEQAMTEAAKFAKSPSITITGSIRTAGVLDWLKKQWNALTTWVKSLRKKEKSIGKSIADLKRMTE